jgi:hypothetical protein
MVNVFTGNKKMNIETRRLAPVNRREVAIRELAPNCAYHTDGENILKWLTPDVPQPTEEAINAKMAELKIEYDAKKYQRDRQPEYPSMPDQLDMQYHDQINGTTTWKDAIDKVKADNPKPE